MPKQLEGDWQQNCVWFKICSLHIQKKILFTHLLESRSIYREGKKQRRKINNKSFTQDIFSEKLTKITDFRPLRSSMVLFLACLGDVENTRQFLGSYQ